MYLPTALSRKADFLVLRAFILRARVPLTQSKISFCYIRAYHLSHGSFSVCTFLHVCLLVVHGWGYFRLTSAAAQFANVVIPSFCPCSIYTPALASCSSPAEAPRGPVQVVPVGIFCAFHFWRPTFCTSMAPLYILYWYFSAKAPALVSQSIEKLVRNSPICIPEGKH